MSNFHKKKKQLLSLNIVKALVISNFKHTLSLYLKKRFQQLSLTQLSNSNIFLSFSSTQECPGYCFLLLSLYLLLVFFPPCTHTFHGSLCFCIKTCNTCKTHLSLSHKNSIITHWTNSYNLSSCLSNFLYDNHPLQMHFPPRHYLSPEYLNLFILYLLLYQDKLLFYVTFLLPFWKGKK